MRQPAIGELAHQMIQPGQAAQLGDLLNAVVRRADDLDLHIGVGHLLPVRLVGHFRVGAADAAISLVALHLRQPAVRESVVVIYRIPLLAQPCLGAVVSLIAGLRTGHVGDDDRRTRRMPGLHRHFVEIIDFVRGLRPFVVHHNQQAQARTRDQLRRFGAVGRSVKPPFGVRNRGGTDRGARNLEVLPIIFETRLREAETNDVQPFLEARTRFVHRDAETFILHPGGTAAEPEDATPARQDVQQRNLFGNPDRIVPGNDDHPGAQMDPFGSPGVVRQELQRRGRHRVAGEMMLQREQRIKPQRLRQVAKLHMLVQNRRIGASWLTEHVERHSDFHDRPPPGTTTTTDHRVPSGSHGVKSAGARLACASPSPPWTFPHHLVRSTHMRLQPFPGQLGGALRRNPSAQMMRRPTTWEATIAMLTPRAATDGRL